MAKQLHKSLQDYISKLKKPSPPQLNLSSRPLSLSTNWIPRGCKHPRTPSFLAESSSQGAEDDSATLADIDRFLQENFKSLYENDFDTDSNNQGNDDNGAKMNECSFDSSAFQDPMTELCGSHGFSVGSTSSYSLIEETDDIESINENKSIKVSDCDENKGGGNDADDFIAVLTYSPKPYDDFRRSMLEMIEARLHYNNGKVNWEFMEELLFCYLNLNHKKSYKYILRAFVDLIVVLRQNSGEIPARSVRKCHPETEA